MLGHVWSRHDATPGRAVRIHAPMGGGYNGQQELGALQGSGRADTSRPHRDHRMGSRVATVAHQASRTSTAASNAHNDDALAEFFAMTRVMEVVRCVTNSV